jgi:antitoxin (DNA-binding transcriptional repressor) of toxin-antitoxin stability system
VYHLQVCSSLEGFMTSKTVSVTDAASSLLSLLGEVQSQGQAIDIMDGNRVVARLTPPFQPSKTSRKDLSAALQTLQHLNAAEAQAFAHDVKAGLRALRPDAKEW